MTARFRAEPEASAELSEAALWYERQRDGLGGEFLEAIDAALEFIARFPHAGVPVPGLPPELPVRRVPDGRREVSRWKASRMTAASHVMGNIRSRPQFRAGAWQRLKIVSVLAAIERPKGD